MPPSETERGELSASAERVRRLFAIVAYLDDHGPASRSTLARALDAQVRAINADLRDLHAAGRVLPLGEGKARRWYTQALERPAGILDRIALRLGRDVLVFLDGTALSEVFDRLDGQPHGRDLDRKFVHLQEPARSYASQAEVLDEVLEALIPSRWLEIRYRSSSGEERAQRVRPLTLVVYRRALYLLALDEREEVLRLAVDRIGTAEAGAKFGYPADWDPQQELSPYFGIHKSRSPERVVLRFAADKAELVRSRVWHRTERQRVLEDGRIELVMRVGGVELVRFVLEWGPYCEVVGPAWLRAEVVRELRSALANYPEGEGEFVLGAKPMG
jgi:predicted DNA-binding transcriptional regulator YafY